MFNVNVKQFTTILLMRCMRKFFGDGFKLFVLNWKVDYTSMTMECVLEKVIQKASPIIFGVVILFQ